MSITEGKQIPILGCDLDSDELRIRENKARFIKGMLFNSNRNTGSASGEGGDYGVLTPLESNTRLTGGLTMPEGVNYCVGYKESKETNEGFVFVYNSAEQHSIYCINGKDGTAQFVYRGRQLNFKYAPENFINSTRCVVRVIPYINPVTGIKDTRTFLAFTDNNNDVRCICKEDSIATNSFFYDLSTPFFKPLNAPVDRELEFTSRYINLAIEPPLYCISIMTAPVEEGDDLKQNALKDKGFQFRVKFIDIYGRESEHGIISERFFLLSGNSCIRNSVGLPRCLDVTFNTGSPFVNKIQIEYRTCQANDVDVSIDSGWVKTDLIDKYEFAPGVNWWEREINSNYQYDVVTNNFTYRFCSDKLCEPIDEDETSRLFNPVPLTSASLFPIRKGIGLANNERDFEPSDVDQLKKIEFSLVEPDGGPCENIAPRKIVVYAFLYSRNVPTSNPIDRVGQVRYDSDRFLYYQGINDRSVVPVIDYFAPGLTGFVGYLAGTNYAAISTQIVHYYDNDTEGPLDTLDTARPYAILQRFEFLVVPGKYIFRIASTLNAPDGDYQKTSTYVYGQINPLNFVIDKIEKELVLDACSSDIYMPDRALVIYDAQVISPMYGYVYEDEVNNNPVELAPLSWNCAVMTNSVCWYTDHNGFYFLFMSLGSGGNWEYDASFYSDLCTTNVQKDEVGSVGARVRVKNIHFFTSTNEYPDNARRYFELKVTLCGQPLIGVPGIPIVLRNGGVTYTDSSGIARGVMHNRYTNTYVTTCSNPSTPAPPAARNIDWQAYGDLILVTQNGLCQITNCEGCIMCFDDYDIAWEACTGPNREYDLGSLEVLLRGENKKGPKNGGRYGLGVVFHDWAGRCSAVQKIPEFFLDIPSLLTLKRFDFYKIRFDIDAAFSAPSWARYMTFCITQNLNWGNDMMWVVDRVRFVDGAGNEGAPNPVKVRFYYESLIQYSTQNNGGVNSAWTFTQTNGASVTGDRVEFIQRPNGEWYETLVSALVVYSKEGRYFEVDYTTELADVADGTLIKLIKANDCINRNIYFELCPSIVIKDGIPQMLNGIFNYADSYFINRIIPTPVYTVDPDNDNAITRIVIPKAYVYFYEHHSPSDFWGDHCITRGRVHAVNDYEKKKFNGNEIALSQALINKGSFFGLSYFMGSDVKAFDQLEWGNITAVIVENVTVLVICEKNNFVVGFNDPGVSVDATGRVIAPSAPNEFGNPQRRIGQDYGCKMRDINTIQNRNGVVAFLDTTKSKLVFHTFGEASDIAFETGSKSWIDASVVAVNMLLNQPSENNRIPYFHGGIDPKNEEYYLTRFDMYFPLPPTLPPDPQPTRPVYINNETDVRIVGGSETAVYNIRKGQEKMFKGFAPFTPEMYGTLEGFYLDANMLTMRDSHSWSHHSHLGAPFNNFYGTQTKKVIRMVWNNGTETVKNFLYSEVYCKEHKFVAKVVKTQKGQLSRILAAYWERFETFFSAAFLCATNTAVDPNLPLQTGANALIDGDNMQGQWIDVTYVSEDADDPKYSELSAIACYMNEQGKSSK